DHDLQAAVVCAARQQGRRDAARRALQSHGLHASAGQARAAAEVAEVNVRFARLTTTALGAVCGVLVLAALLQYAGVGRGYSWAADDPESAPPLPGGTVDDKPLKLPPETAFAEVERHPLFNEDRQPTPVDASASGDEADSHINPLNITLTGIV